MRVEVAYRIYDESFNQSAAFHLESELISMMLADRRFVLMNRNQGRGEFDYYDKQRYTQMIPEIWSNLTRIGLASHSLDDVRNSNIFKYSPYKQLSEDQMEVVLELLDLYQNSEKISHSRVFVQGRPGTGKTLVAIYLLKRLVDEGVFSADEVALVCPMSSLRKTLENICKHIYGLSAKNVISPSDAIKHHLGEGRPQYKLLIVDEAHRLKQKRNLSASDFKVFKEVYEVEGYEGTHQLDWLERAAENLMLFYDEGQSVRPTDVPAEAFRALKARASRSYELTRQHRVSAGAEVISALRALLDGSLTHPIQPEGYEICLFESFPEMRAELMAREAECGLCRLVSGYFFKSKTRTQVEACPPYILEGEELVWNTQMVDWVNSANALNEVGCIHTVQGYDLNYVGVILGEELSYDAARGVLTVNADRYLDRYGKQGVEDPDELLLYIKNVYHVLMTRGVRGVYLYACQPSLRAYLARWLPYQRRV